MFKAFGNFIHRTPWWAMVLLGFCILMLMVLFSAPVHVMRLSESGSTPDERRAIKREIDRAFGDSALNVAENIVGAIKNRSSDPSRRQELEHALAEIAQARKDIYNAQRDAGKAANQALRDAHNAAFEAARDAAETALDAAREARQAVEEAKRDAAEKLKSSGADSTATLRAFDDMITAAKTKEQAAKGAVAKIAESKKRGVPFDINLVDGALKINVDPDTAGAPVPPVSPVPPVPRVPPVSVEARGLKNDFPRAASNPPGAVIPPKVPTPSRASEKRSNNASTETAHGENGTAGPGRSPNSPMVPLPPLPPELRDDIHAKVASDFYRIGVGSALVLAFIPIFIMLLIAKYFIDRSRRATAFAEQKKKEAEISNVNRQITEARLQALQAQVEPHFLYNTLANVQALTEVDPVQANLMTGHLIQYLRSSLPKMRENTSTVGQEIELVRAYLNILKMRMGDRLAFDIDCPAELNAISFPPLMLPSLVENAIKHGLEPQREGGRIDVLVQRMFTADGERIRILVKDTGRGLSDTPTQAGGGVGLANIRERLIAIYGDGGKLILESNPPKGVSAAIEVPVETANVKDNSHGTGSALSAGAPGAMISKPAPKGWWNRTRHAAAATHGVWAKVMSVTFITLMIALAVVFGLLLAGMYTGLVPIQMGTAPISGLEGMALATLVLLAAFSVIAMVLLVVVGVLYGLGLLFAGLVVVIPLIILIGAVPTLAPFVLVGLAVYWFWWRKRDEKKIPAGGL